MKTKNIFYIFSALLAVGIILSAGAVFAQKIDDIQYPIAELGKCKDRAGCKLFCDKSESSNTCLAFALKNNLMSQSEVNEAKKFMAAVKNGPGGCTTRDSCKKYCDDINNIEECISFAEKYDLTPAQKLQKSKRVQAALLRGIGLPNCKNTAECDAYCDNTDHMQECIAFGQSAELLEGKSLENAQKIFRALKNGITPPPCRGKKECDKYCTQEENAKACTNFSIQADLMSDQERINAQKMLTAINGGARLPKCKNKEECAAYCQEENHVDECISFAEKAGLVTIKEAKKIRGTRNIGPGGCANKDKCKKYCDENPDECKKFQPGSGIINPGGNMMPQQAGHAGCKGPEECAGYCDENPEKCKNSVPCQGEECQVRPEDELNKSSSFITPESVLGAIIYGVKLFVPGK